MTLIPCFRRLAVNAGIFCVLTGVGVSQVLLPGHVTSCPSLTCTLGAATGSGDLVVVGIQLGGGVNTGTTITGVTDSAGNTYVQATGARAIDTTSGSVIDVWYAKSSLPGASTVTVTPSAAVTGGLVVWEFSGINTTAPLDQAAVLNSQGATVSPSGAPVTISSPNEVIISLAAVGANITGLSAGNAFTSDSSLKGNGWAHLVSSATGTYSASWVQSSSATYASSTVSFKGGATSCDINNDGQTNVLDVQLITNMEIQAPGFTCTANVAGAGCTDSARSVVINAALGASCHYISLAWSPSTGSVSGYNIYRSTASNGPFAKANSSLITTTNFSDLAMLQHSQTYFYYATAVDTSGNETTPSTQVSVFVP